MKNNIKEYKISIIWIAVHILLGYLSSNNVSITKMWNASVILLGFYFIIAKKNKNNEAALWSAYYVGMEVLLRITHGYFGYEMGKYMVIVFMILGEMMNPSKYKNKVWIFMILLLLPSLLVTDWSYKDRLKDVLFAISGLIVLGVSAFYFYGRTISWNDYKKILSFLLLPILSLSVLLTIRTPDFSQIDFASASNFVTSGGFGPVHVSSVIGCGLVILGIFIFLKSPLFVNQIGNIAVWLFFLYRGLLTLSRSGLFSAAIALGFVLIQVFRSNTKKAVKIGNVILYAVIVSAFGLFLWNEVNSLTKGMAYNRFSGRNSQGQKMSDISSGRTELAEQEWQLFLRNPVFGIGPGMISEVRMELFGYDLSSHTEYTRLLSEHGIFGIIIVIILIYIPIIWYHKTTGYTRVFFVGLIIFSLLCMIPAATRTALPCFIFGLAFVKIKEDYLIKTT